MTLKIETRRYSDGTRATGTAPLPPVSPAQQDIKAALVAARKYALWPAGREPMEDVVALIDRALAHLP